MISANPDTNIQELISRRYAALGGPTPLFYDEPLHIVRGAGTWLFDNDGQRYLDGYNNVPHVGHCHPRVVQALATQAATLNIHTRYLHENVIRYGERLTETLHPSLSTALFVCTGSEANELAIRIARHHTKAQGLLVTDFSYHGTSTTLAALATGIQTNEKFPANARAIRVPDTLRDLRPGLTVEALLETALAQADEAINSLVRDGHGVAALMVDTLFSTEGLLSVPPGYLAGLVSRVRAAGGLFIADEVQPGFGRIGSKFWGYELHDVVPDFVTLGKPMGNGHPLAGTVTRPELANAFLEEAMFFNTFAGTPVSAAVGLAVLDVLQEEKLMENALLVGKHAQQRLASLATNNGRVLCVRGQGLFFGLELVSDAETRMPDPAFAKRIVNEMRRRHILISTIGRHNNVLKIRPPMVFSQSDADLLIDTLTDVLDAVS